MPTITIIPAVHNDITNIIRLADCYHRDHLTAEQRRKGFLGKVYTVAELVAIIEKQEIVVAKHDAELIGFYLIGNKHDGGAQIYVRNRQLDLFDRCDRPRTDIAYPTQVCIEFEYRGRGLFKRMLNALTETVNKRYRAIYCSISEENIASQRAHEKAGWCLINQFEGRCFYLLALSTK